MPTTDPSCPAWIIPVCGGGGEFPPTPSVARTNDLLNVQWGMWAFPFTGTPLPTLPLVTVQAITSFIRGAAGEPSRLENCHAVWRWNSIGSCEENEVLVGARLAIGTVFSRFLPQYTSQPEVQTVGY